MGFFAFLSQAVTFGIGAGIAMSLFIFMQWRMAVRWRYLARHYARPLQRAREQRTMQSGVLYGWGAFNSYKRVLTIGLHETGVSLSIMSPFSYFYCCAPLFIPFSEIRGWQQQWYLDARSIELEFRRAPEVKILMPADQVEWIRGASHDQMQVREEMTPHRDKPTVLYYLTIAQGAMGIGLGLYLLVDWLMVTS